jgi:hypothetical protein
MAQPIQPQPIFFSGFFSATIDYPCLSYYYPLC